MSDFSDKGVIL